MVTKRILKLLRLVNILTPVGCLIILLILSAILNILLISRQQSQNNQLISSLDSKKWIVVTSVNLPTAEVKKLSQIPGWQLLIVADKKSPKNWALSNVIFLDMDSQLKLGYRVLSHLPWNSYTRKVIGYLYAIQHGAQFIYDTDDVHAAKFEQAFIFEQIGRGLLLTDKNNRLAVNPYVHFGQPSVWPRGFPLDLIGQPYNNTYIACQMKTPIIQQGIVNGNPDLDSIFCLTRKKFQVQFDNSAPPLILPKSVLAPFNSRNTIFHYDGFWALILPISVTSRVADIWRGYWAQPLLWMIGARLGFSSFDTMQIKNHHQAYLRDFGDEEKLYKQGSELVKFLSNWNCSSDNLFSCMLELTSLMARRNFWDEREVKYMEAWIQDLKEIGYTVPQFSNFSSSPCLEDKPQTFAVFNGIEKSEKSETSPQRIHLRKFCNLPISDSSPKLKKSIVFPNILLVVTFNGQHFDNIWLLDLIFRSHYPNILYCGQLKNNDTTHLTRILAKKEFVEAAVKKFSFVHAEAKGGQFVYECAMRAIEMNYKVKGYLFLSDDILLNFWNNGQFNPEEMWIQNKFAMVNTHLPKKNYGWAWYKSCATGWKATQVVYKKMFFNPSKLNQSQHIRQFVHTREANGYNSSMWMVTGSDLFYFPASKQEMVYDVGWLLRKSKVFLELAVPFIASGLSASKNLVLLNGKSLWGKGRSNPFSFFNKSKILIHPVKLGQLIKQPKLKQQFCTKYIPNIL